MQRQLIVAGFVSVLLISGMVLVWQLGQRTHSARQRASNAEATSAAGRADAREGLEGARHDVNDVARGVAGGRGLSDGEGAPAMVNRRLRKPAGARRTLRTESAGEVAAGGLAGESSAQGSASGSGGSEDSGVAAGLLDGEKLAAALLDALGAEELGPLQGLLISGLTEDGSKFTADDVPTLFDALLASDDFGMQKLALTHLERIDAPPEALIDGYLEFLEGGKRPAHSEDIFERLVDLGGSETVGALGELLGRTTNERLARQTADALGKLGDEAAVPALEEALRRSDGGQGRRELFDALAQIGGRRALGSLIDWAARTDDEAAVRAVRNIEDIEAAPFLAGALRQGSSDSFLRSTLRTLGKLRDPRTLGDLERYLGRAPAELTRDTVYSLSGFADPQAARILEAYALSTTDPKLAKHAQKGAQRVQKNIERLARGSQERQRKTPKRRG